MNRLLIISATGVALAVTIGFISLVSMNASTESLQKGASCCPAAPATTQTAALASAEDVASCPISGVSACTLSDEELRAKLSPEQYRIVRENGTERPFRNAFWDHKEAGLYVDVVSGEPLFASVHKFNSGTGWPSFTQPVVSENVVEVRDVSHGMVRIEVRSKYADSHLGHVFPDGPRPTNLRYCINSGSLRFVPVAELEAQGYGRLASIFAADAPAVATVGVAR